MSGPITMRQWFVRTADERTSGICDEYEAGRSDATAKIMTSMERDGILDAPIYRSGVNAPESKCRPLLEAAEEAQKILGSVLDVERGRTSRASVRLLESAYDALAAAIKEERER